jgi:hypothetical protein
MSTSYQLVKLDFFESTHSVVAELNCCDLCCAPQPNVQHAIDLIVADQQHSEEHMQKLKLLHDIDVEQITAADIYLSSVAGIVKAYSDLSDAFNNEETSNYLKNANVLASFGVDADECDDYIIVQVDS